MSFWVSAMVAARTAVKTPMLTTTHIAIWLSAKIGLARATM